MTLPTVNIIEPISEDADELAEKLKSPYFNTVVFKKAEDYLESFDPDCPNTCCLISEIRLPGISGKELLTHLQNQEYYPPVIFLTSFGDIRTAVDCLKDGAFHFFEKNVPAQILWETIQNALLKDARDRSEFLQRKKYLHRYALLTPKERKIFEMILEGSSNKAMAAMLNLKSKTIEYHRKVIKRKLCVETTAEMIRTFCVLKIDYIENDMIEPKKTVRQKKIFSVKNDATA